MERYSKNCKDYVSLRNIWKSELIELGRELSIRDKYGGRKELQLTARFLA